MQTEVSEYTEKEETLRVYNVRSNYRNRNILYDRLFRPKVNVISHLAIKNNLIKKFYVSAISSCMSITISVRTSSNI